MALPRRDSTIVAVLAAGTMCLTAIGSLGAQGVSGAAISGRVVGDSAAGLGVSGAQVDIRNTATGADTRLVTGGDGRFDAENLPPGGPYLVEARAVGYAPLARRVLRLGLTERFDVALALTRRAAPTLQTVQVTGTRAATIRDVNRTGPAPVVSDSGISRLPVLSRDFVDLIQTTPAVVGTSVGGINNRYNNITVDGGANNDYFGLSRGTGTPGGQEGTRSLPLDAIEEFRVSMSPYDVRRGNFAGGEIDAITRSGTNTVHGSAYSLYYDQSLAGSDTTGRRAPDFRTYDYGVTVGGPIMPDRLHFFLAAEEKQRSSPYAGPLLVPGVGISPDSATRFAGLLRGYGLNPGTFGPYTVHGLARNFFAKLSAPTGGRGSVDLSVNYADGQTADTIAPPRADPGDYRFTSAAWAQTGITRAVRLRWFAYLHGGVANELLADELQSDEPREPSSGGPAVFVSGVGAAGSRLIAGGDPSSQTLTLRQRSEEITDNLTVPLGAHTLTAGVRAQFLQFYFASLVSSVGQYQFASLAAFAAGTPSNFTRNIPLYPGGDVANFASVMPGAYIQDQWQLPRGLTLTGGLRMDLPVYLNSPVSNPAAAASVLAVHTSQFIAANPVLSPRLGAHWALDDATVVRGGVGVFAGPNPYNWLSWPFAFTGLSQAAVSCKGAAAPAFVASPSAQPAACVGGGGTQGNAEIVYFDPHYKMPEEFKASAGADRALGWGVVGSFDVLYQYALDNLAIVNRNLSGPVGSLAGEGGRVMYGAVAPSSAAGTLAATSPSVIVKTLGPVLYNTNSSGDHAFVATVRAEKQFASGIEFDVAYTYTDAVERMSLRDAQTVSNFGFTPLEGSFANRALATSTYDVPHKITVSATANGPLGSRLSLIYLGRSGYPFTYVVNGDANGDGVGDKVGLFPTQQNDPVYIPKSGTDISLVRDGAGGLLPAGASAYDSLDAFINRESCLRDHRGALLPRNACRNPWQNILNARVAERVPVPGRADQAVQITLEVFNVLNLLDRTWGLIRETGTLAGAGTENVPLLTLRGTDAALGRNLYQLSLPQTNLRNVAASRWQMQLGVRYAF